MPAEIDWSLLKPTPDMLGGTINAYETGRALAQQAGVQNAFQTAATNPTAGAQQLTAFGDTADAAAVTQAGQALQDRQSRIAAASTLAGGNIGGAESSLAQTGDLQGVTALQNEAIGRHMAQLQFAQQEASKIYAAGQGITDPQARTNAYLAAFDAEAPRFQQLGGATPDDLAQLRSALQSSPDTVLRSLMAPPEYSTTQIGDNEVGIVDKTTGNLVGKYQGTKFVTVPPANSVVQVGGDGGGGQSGAAPAPVAAGAPPPPPPAGGSAPLSVRLNNPGALRPLPSGNWAGQTGTAGGFAQFATPEAGAAAASQNLIAKQTRHGLTTLTQIIGDPTYGWAPAADNNNPGAYAAAVGKAAGVDPNAPIDIVHNADLRQRVLNAMYNVESGSAPGTYQNGQSAPAAAAAPAAQPPQATTQPTAPGSGAKVVAQGQPAFGPPQTVPGLPGQFQRGADGKLTPVEGSGYQPKDILDLREHVTGNDEYKQAQAGLAAYQAMTANADKMTGPAAYSILDTFARAINPGAVARPTVIQTLEDHIGLPNKLLGALENAGGAGNLPPETRQQLIDAVLGFVNAHWDQANGLNQANAQFAQRHGIDPADVTAPLPPRPTRYVIGSAPAATAPSMTPAAPFHGGLSPAQWATVKGLPDAHGSPTGSQGNPYTPASEQEYNTLPKGAHYVFTDGRVMVKQ